MKQINIAINKIDNGFIVRITSYDDEGEDFDYYDGESKELYAPDKAAVEKIIAENLTI